MYRPVLADGRREGERSVFVQDWLVVCWAKGTSIRGGDGFGLAWASKEKSLVDSKRKVIEC